MIVTTVGIVSVVALGACIPPGAVTCADGKLCADGTTCVLVSDPSEDICATLDQLAACNGLADHVRCGANGRCYTGVCLPIVCGNSRLDRADPNDPTDRGEACDDGNQTSGDGCSADCSSDETCGNGVVDPIRGELCDDGNRIQHDGCDSTCQPEQPRWTQLPGGGPSVRSGHAMAYDFDRERVVLFGGVDASGTNFDDTWEWNGAGWIRLSPPVSPSPRSGHAMAYDPIHRRVVLFGGGVFEGDTWTWDGSVWTPMAPATSPSARAGHVMTFDSKHVILVDGAGPVGDGEVAWTQTWKWDGNDWALSPLVPPSNAIAISYDPVRARTLLFDSFGATWESDGASWTNVATTGPEARATSAMAFDLNTHSVLLFGGGESGPAFADQWLWDGSKWRSVIGGLPIGRFGHAMVEDPVRRRVVMFGGTSNDASTWEWDGSGWNETPPLVMPARDALAVARDSARGITNMVGLQGGTSLATSLFDGTSWIGATSKLPALQTPATAMTFDELRGVTVLVADIHTLITDGTSWVEVENAPLRRIEAGFVFDGQRSILFGGNIDGPVDETWAWDGQAWSQLMPAHRPSARADMAIARDPIRGEVVMFGGATGATTLGDTWVWTGTDWVERTPATRPPSCRGAKLAWNASRQRLTLFGGIDTGALDAVWEWDGTTWTHVSIPNPPPARRDHAWFATRDGSGLVVFGGRPTRVTGLGLSDTWLLRWDGSHADESCHANADDDGDGLPGCADPDCWAVCAPECPPGTSCGPSAPRCGDGHCDPVEDCRTCPSDCQCKPICGDFVCDPGEDHQSCPGDC